jgi:hypothetical protein
MNSPCTGTEGRTSSRARSTKCSSIKQVSNAGEWNHYRIDLRGLQLKVWLNNILIQDANMDTVTQKVIPHENWKEAVQPLSQRPHRGHIGFQELSELREQLIYRDARIAVLD